MGQFPSSPEIKKFHDYRLKSILGSGSFGVVWEMDGENQNRALKIILVDPQNEERQKRELSISLEVKHINLVEVFTVERKETKSADLGTLVPMKDSNCASIIIELRRKKTFEVFCLTLELCGETLRKWLKEKQEDASVSTTNIIQFEIVKNILEGLKYLHSKKIIHRDLKPENIMFSKKGYILPVKIGDYGTCRILKDPGTSTLTSSVGTDLYSAPETSSNDYNLQSDLFSLGLIVWEVLQLIPFQNLKNHFDRLVHDREDGLVQLCPRFESLRVPILSLCDKNVQKRLKSLDQINLNVCNFGTEYVAEDSAALKSILWNCEDGWTIWLGEGVYEGEFKITKRGVTLIGISRERTILSPSRPFCSALEVVGADFKAMNLKVDGTGREGVTGINVQATNCTLVNINISDIPCTGKGITNFRALNTKLNNVRFEDVDRPIFVEGGNVNIKDVIINNCSKGIELNDVDNSFIQSVSITRANQCGIFIFASKKIHIQNVKIISDKTFTMTLSQYPTCGIGIISCPEGNIDLGNVSCSGLFRGGEEAGLYISKNSLSANVTEIDCNIGNIIKDVQGY